ncbi:hypothetical protein HAHE_07130 [Haloferula helveola]|uniref:PEP-CTERM protein-sorting domain-containing protein n=1 Tax=Haloferula helveola TaxID=490095 RepID=A0ABM7R7L9_9BACT|nr:hypothetical protein HAHE_07130 [Haloferula helveola]
MPLKLALSPLVLLLAPTAFAGVIFTDSFSGSGAPGAAWVSDEEINATVNVSGGSLNVNAGTVTGLSTVRHTLELTGTGAPTLTLGSSWTVEAVTSIADGSAFSTMAGGEGVQVTLGVRNNLPATDDRAQVNFVNLNFGAGPQHAVRGAHRTGGSETENITIIGDATASLTATIRMAYDASLDQITMGLDTGSGFFSLVSPVDTSAWSMTDSDPLLIQFELGLAKFSGDPASSTFSIEDGELTVDEFNVYDEALSTNTVVPEPSVALLSLVALGFAFRRRR